MDFTTRVVLGVGIVIALVIILTDIDVGGPSNAIKEQSYKLQHSGQ